MSRVFRNVTAGDRAAERIAELLLQPADWIHRRVESVEFLPSGETRRNISVDLTLPKRLAVDASRDRCLAPIALLKKAPLRRLDIRAADSAPLPVLTTEQNGAITAAALQAVTRNLLALGPGDSAQVDSLLHHVAFWPAEDAATEAERFNDWLRHAHGPVLPYELELLESLVAAMAVNFLFAVELDRQLLDRRTILKFSYEAPADSERRTLPFAVSMPGPQLGMAKSCHLEVRAPAGLQVRVLVVQEQDGAGTPLYEWSDFGDNDSQKPGQVGHVAARASEPFTQAVSQVEFVPERQGLLNAALVAAVTGLALILAPAALGLAAPSYWATVLHDPGRAGAVATILLAAPALLAAWLARPPEHTLVAGALWRLRLIISLTSVVLFLAAATVALGSPPRVFCVVWAILTGVQVWVVIDAFEVRGIVRGSPYAEERGEEASADGQEE